MSDRLKQINRQRTDDNLREQYAKGRRYMTEYHIDGKLPLVRGRRFKINGDGKYYIFHYAGTDKGGDWISADGPYSKNGTDAGGLSHCFDPADIRQVERSVPITEFTIETPAERAERLGLNEKAAS